MNRHIIAHEPKMLAFNAQEAERFVLDFIRQEHPEWVREDGSCPKCFDYYKSLDQIETVALNGAEEME